MTFASQTSDPIALQEWMDWIQSQTHSILRKKNSDIGKTNLNSPTETRGDLNVSLNSCNLKFQEKAVFSNGIRYILILLFL